MGFRSRDLTVKLFAGSGDTCPDGISCCGCSDTQNKCRPSCKQTPKPQADQEMRMLDALRQQLRLALAQTP